MPAVPVSGRSQTEGPAPGVSAEYGNTKSGRLPGDAWDAKRCLGMTDGASGNKEGTTQPVVCLRRTESTSINSCGPSLFCVRGLSRVGL